MPAPVLPDDRFNQELVANVRPPDWQNPEPADRYNLVVIGAGTAGLVTAAVAAGARCQGGTRRAAPDGRRLSQRRLRALQGCRARGPRRGPRPRMAPSSASRSLQESRAGSASRWSGCAGSEPASAAWTQPDASRALASTSSSERVTSPVRIPSTSLAQRCGSSARRSARAPAQPRCRSTDSKTPRISPTKRSSLSPRCLPGWP